MKTEDKSIFEYELLLSSILCWIFLACNNYIPLPKSEQNIIGYVSLFFAMFFTINYLIFKEKNKFLRMYSQSNKTKQAVIDKIKSTNAIAEIGYEDGILTHLSCEIEIDGINLIVEFAVPSNQLDISNDKLFDATKLTDYITEYS